MNRYQLLLVSAALSAGLVFTGCNKSGTQQQAASQPAAAPASEPPSTPPAATPAPAPAPAASGSTANAAPPAPAPAAAPERAAAPAPAPPPAPPPPLVVPAGTTLAVRIASPISSKTSTPGQSFNGTLVNSVTVKGSRAIPAGAAVSGTVTEAKSAGRFKGAASLGLTLQSITVHGRNYEISTNTFSQQTNGKGKRTAGFVGGGAGGGALIGGLAGGGKGALIGGLVGAGAGTAGAALTGNNRDISLTPETTLSFTLANSLTLGRGANSAE